MNNRKEIIDYSEILALTDKELKEFHRVSSSRVEAARKALQKKYGVKIVPHRGRPPKGVLKYHSIHMRIAPDVLTRVRARAHKRGVGYQTLINEILSRAVQAA